MNTIFTKKILEFCSNYNLPFLFHNNISSYWNKTYPKFIHEIEEVISEYPRAKVILAHCWISRWINIVWFIHIIDRLMTEYQNLYLDYS